MSSQKTSGAETLEDLKQLGLDAGPLFFPQLLKTFERDAVEHLIGLRVAIAGDEPGRLRGEAHALKGVRA
jgi:HPt (histidine-containing phosphotransfer) domain-containing protein